MEKGGKAINLDRRLLLLRPKQNPGHLLLGRIMLSWSPLDLSQLNLKERLRQPLQVAKGLRQVIGLRLRNPREGLRQIPPAV
jgi:hypothetical protein